MSEEAIISIRGLRMQYGDKYVLRGVDLDVFPGQLLGYIGPNGAGKSTTIKTMLGLVQNYTGEIRVFGKDIADGDIAYKSRIGYVPETAEIYDSLTANEYLAFVASLYGVDEKLSEWKISNLIRLLGLLDVANTRMSSYSKGMRQKVLLISSLLHNPDILFLDEPLSGLDANSIMVVKEMLSQLAAQGKTIFYSSHIMDVVEKISHRIILLHGGQVVADGSFDELKQQCMEQSLEDIFNQLTGFHEHKALAEQVVSVVQEV